MNDKRGFILDMQHALDALRAAIERHPEHAQDYLPACIHIELAMRCLNDDPAIKH